MVPNSLSEQIWGGRTETLSLTKPLCPPRPSFLGNTGLFFPLFLFPLDLKGISWHQTSTRDEEGRQRGGVSPLLCGIRLRLVCVSYTSNSHPAALLCLSKWFCGNGRTCGMSSAATKEFFLLLLQVLCQPRFPVLPFLQGMLCFEVCSPVLLVSSLAADS